MRNAGILVTAIGIAIGSGVGEASGAPRPTEPTAVGESADTLFQRALRAYDAGDCASAVPVFREALAKSGSPNARLYVGICLRKMGRLAEAYRELERTLRETAEPGDREDKYAKTREVATGELAALEPRVAKVVVTATEQASDGMIAANGVTLGRDEIGVPLAFEPGLIVVTSRAPGRTGERREVQLSAGKVHAVTIAYGAAAVAPVAAPPGALRPAPLPEEPNATGGEARIAGFAVAGLGAASMIAFGVCFSVADGKFTTLEEECGDDHCPDASYQDVIDDGRAAGTAANVTLVLGLASLAAGAAMIIFGGASEDDGTFPSTTVGLVPALGGGLLSWAGEFW